MPWRRRRPDPEPDQRLAAMYAERVEAQDQLHPGYAEAWNAFVAIVLSHGGLHVVPPRQPDPLIDLLGEEGQVQDGTLVLDEGGPSDCHRNVVALYHSGRAAAIGTGYALSDDGLWREHSWGISATGDIHETTVVRLSYFGVTMREDRADWFADWIEGD